MPIRQAVVRSTPRGVRSRQKSATITPDRATVEPIDRSINPPIMTMVMPSAMTPFRELLRKMFIQFDQVMKPFDAKGQADDQQDQENFNDVIEQEQPNLFSIKTHS